MKPWRTPSVEVIRQRERAERQPQPDPEARAKHRAHAAAIEAQAHREAFALRRAFHPARYQRRTLTKRPSDSR
ncbi:MAG: hypothetical protein AAF589_04730 [Planctomycetota bacterium]